MKPATREWVEKAEGDFISALREYRARKKPNYDAACFHAQQCVEKYIKALLQERELPFPKTHDLVLLAGLMTQLSPLGGMRQELSILSSYAVEFRYPGESAEKETAKEAIDYCKVIRKVLRKALRIEKR